MNPVFSATVPAPPDLGSLENLHPQTNGEEARQNTFSSTVGPGRLHVKKKTTLTLSSSQNFTLIYPYNRHNPAIST